MAVGCAETSKSDPQPRRYAQLLMRIHIPCNGVKVFVANRRETAKIGAGRGRGGYTTRISVVLGRRISLVRPLPAAMAANPSGSNGNIFSSASRGIASLNPRLMAENPSGSARTLRIRAEHFGFGLPRCSSGSAGVSFPSIHILHRNVFCEVTGPGVASSRKMRPSSDTSRRGRRRSAPAGPRGSSAVSASPIRPALMGDDQMLQPQQRVGVEIRHVTRRPPRGRYRGRTEYGRSASLRPCRRPLRAADPSRGACRCRAGFRRRRPGPCPSGGFISG